MEIEDILNKDSVTTSVKAKSKKQVLQEMAGFAAKHRGLLDRDVFDIILERERLGTTGVGNGIAIPHGKISSLDSIYGCFARLAEPIDFEAEDGTPVDLIFLLLAPELAGADHLKALARISKIFRDADKCDQLRAIESPEQLYQLLISEHHNQAV